MNSETLSLMQSIKQNAAIRTEVKVSLKPFNGFITVTAIWRDLHQLITIQCPVQSFTCAYI